MSKENALKISKAIMRAKPSTPTRRVAYQEAIASANRNGKITNNEAHALLWLLEEVKVHKTRKHVKRKRSYRSR